MCEKYNLDRFLEAQENMYEIALSEMKQGEKLSHWMWYIFPQLKGLGYSYKANFYGIDGIEEAKCYLNHPILGQRLKEICEVLLNIENKTAKDIFFTPDDLKFHSSLTLFAFISEDNSIFHKLLEKYFNLEMDKNSLKLLNEL